QILFLLLFPAIFVQAKQNNSIDWKRCSNADAKCFVEGSCIKVYSAPTHEEHYELRPFIDVPSKLVDEKCNTGVQLIPLSDEKVMIKIQVIGEELKDNLIGLYQEDTLLIGCEADSDGKNVKIIHDNGFIKKKTKPVLYEEFSMFESKYALCVLTIGRYNKFFLPTIIKVPKSPPTPMPRTILKFHPAHIQDRQTAPAGTLKHGEIPFSNFYGMFEYAKAQLCDSDIIKPQPPRENLHVQRVKDPARFKIDCSNYKEELGVEYDYQLFIQQKTGTPTEAEALVCDSTSGTFKGTTNDPSNDTLIEQSDFSAYCAVDIAKTCANPLINSTLPKDKKPTFTAGNATHSANLTCPGGRWQIQNEYYEWIYPECKEDDMTPNTGAFYMTYPSGMISRMTEGECYKEYDCRKKSNIANTTFMRMTGKEISCTGGRIMRVKFNNITYNETLYKCDTVSGTWKSENGKVSLNGNARVICEERAPPKTEPYTLAQIIGYSGAGMIAAIPIAVGMVYFGFRLNKRSGHMGAMMRLNGWKKKKREDKLALAADVFGKAFVTTPRATVRILTALELIEHMLKMEEEDPDVWELSYPFLHRLYGASRMRGNRLTGLFTRYLFLEVKKIIDKHGWISDTKITRTQNKGYIRTAALRLLFYCRFNSGNEEVTKFIGEGFEKLRYNAVEQYPHCGMLWSHVATTRCKAMNQRFFNDILRISEGHEPMEIPEEDRFLEIGNINEQAAAAVGGALCWQGKHWQPNRTPLVPVNALGLSYIKGIMRSSQTDMGLVMRATYEFEHMKEVVQMISKEKMDEFLERTMRICACHGQERVAQRLEDFYLYEETPEEKRLRKDPSKKIARAYPVTDRFRKIVSEQRIFEKALAEDESLIIDWLTKRTDKKNPSTSSSEESKVTSKSEQGDSSNVQSAAMISSKSLASDESFFTALLQDPIVITRIRECRATADEQKKYRAILAQIFTLDTFICARVKFAMDDIIEILDKTKEIVRTEPMLIEDVPAGITVVTDLHGKLYELHRVLQSNSVDGKPGYECGKYLFLGDYVDRGMMGVEVVMALFIFKILYPDTIFLLRGNHEFAANNRKDGFGAEMYDRFDEDDAELLYAVINNTFGYLSIAAIIGNKIFCAHAGVSTSSFNRHEMRRLEKPYHMSTWDPLLHDIVWSDPSLNMKGVYFNSSRGTSMLFGEDEFVHAMENIDCVGMIRGHETMRKGFMLSWNRLLSVFTITGKGQDGAIALVDENLNVSVRIFEVDNSEWEIYEELASGVGKKKQVEEKSDRAAKTMEDEKSAKSAKTQFDFQVKKQ
ncbi:hypothetical protein PFISCL1PPCAC_4542, partial [Pristionchus fissidentatus]